MTRILFASNMIECELALCSNYAPFNLETVSFHLIPNSSWWVMALIVNLIPVGKIWYRMKRQSRYVDYVYGIHPHFITLISDHTFAHCFDMISWTERRAIFWYSNWHNFFITEVIYLIRLLLECISQALSRYIN